MKHRSIAIDGPSGAGKSTIARRLAAVLGFRYIDTGALYRVIGLAALREGMEADDTEGVAGLLARIQVSLRHECGTQYVMLNGKDVSDAIRAHPVSQAASDLSALPAVRQYLLELQRVFAREGDVVMDGRDIGTVVLPDASLKIFLTAAPEDRARRRYEELAARGENVSYESVLADVSRRDYNDSHRAIAPLKPADDAVIVDTTGNSLERSTAILEALVREKLCFTP